MDIIKRRPEYAQNYSSFFLMKFFDELEYLKCFLDGKLYMRSQTNFDDKDLGKGRADILEGSSIFVSGKKEGSFPEVRFVTNDLGVAHIEVHEHTECPDNYEAPYFALYTNESQRRKMFCMYSLWLNEKSICKINQEMLANFGKYGAIIKCTDEFLQRIDDATELNRTVIDIRAGFVEYFPDDTIVDLNPFMKRKELFEYQNEFRLCAETNNTEPFLLFDLNKSLRDLIIPVKTDMFLDSVKIGDGGIVFNKQDIIKQI